MRPRERPARPRAISYLSQRLIRASAQFPWSDSDARPWTRIVCAGPLPNPMRSRPNPVDSSGPWWYRNYTVDFEFDEGKSRTNKQKHGIDFVKAQALWSDPDLMEIPARTSDEPRFLIIGKIGRRIWSAIITYRGDRVRIISVRRSRSEEAALYEG